MALYVTTPMAQDVTRVMALYVTTLKKALP
jgi:hypothetical protein